MERLEYLLHRLEKLSYNDNKVCMETLNEQVFDLVYYLEAQGIETAAELNHLQACCWLLHEGHHQKTEDERLWTFYYIKDKIARACQALLQTKQSRRVAA